MSATRLEGEASSSIVSWKKPAFMEQNREKLKPKKFDVNVKSTDFSMTTNNMRGSLSTSTSPVELANSQNNPGNSIKGHALDMWA